MNRAVQSAADAASSGAPPVAGAKLWLGMLYGALASTIWGVQAVVSRQSVADGLTAADVTVLRFILAAAALMPFALRLRPFPVGKLGWRRGIVLTLLAGAPYSLVLTGGAAFAPALHAGVITPGLIPVLATVLGVLFAGERAGLARVLGLALIIGGVVMFSLEALGSAPAREGAWRGDALFILAAVMWSLFGLLAKHWGADALDLTVTICLLSALSVPLWAALFPLRLGEATFGAIALQALYQGLLVGVVSLFLYARAVTILGAARAALFLPLVPAVAALAGFVALGEQPSVLEILGMTVVMAGMALALRST